MRKLILRPIKEGERFGRLVFIKYGPVKRVWHRTTRYGDFLCDCGATHRTQLNHVLTGKCISCGCWRQEVARSTTAIRCAKRMKFYTWRGVKQCLMDWARVLNVDYGTLRSRLAAGWSIEKAFTTGTNYSKRKGRNQ